MDQTYNFLASISAIYNLDIKTIINNCIKFLKNDVENRNFLYLNNGEISLRLKQEKILSIS